MIDRRRMNLFDTIEFYGHDIDFEPHELPEPTETAPGSEERVELYRKRLELGQELEHPDDRRLPATIEKQTEMSQRIMAKAKQTRLESKVRRAEAKPKLTKALHAARAAKQRIAEVRKTKTIIRLTRGVK